MICGREDRIVDPYQVEEVVAGLPNFRFVMLDRCGHAPQLEMPQIVNRLVTGIPVRSSRQKSASLLTRRVQTS